MKAALGKWNIVLIDAHLRDRKQRAEVGERTYLDPLDCPSFSKAAGSGLKLPPWVGSSTTRRKPPRARDLTMSATTWWKVSSDTDSVPENSR